MFGWGETHLLLHLLGVLGDDTTLDVALESLGVEGLVLEIVAGVALVVVGDVEATIDSTLERGEHAGSGGGAHEADVEEALERLALALRLDVEILADVVGVTLVRLREVVLGKEATSAEKSGGVGGGIVGEASLHAELRELVRVRRADGHVSLDGGVDQPRVDLAERFVAEPEAIERARPEVLHQHVRLGDHLPEQILAGVGLEIERQAALVGVQDQEEQAVTVLLVAQVRPRNVAARWLLELDHVGPEEAENLRAGGPRLVVRHVDDADA